MRPCSPDSYALAPAAVQLREGVSPLPKCEAAGSRICEKRITVTMSSSPIARP